MSDLTAQLQLRYGVEPKSPSFILEVDDRDAHLDSPISVARVLVPSWEWTKQQYKDLLNARGQRALDVLENGKQHVRLYADTSIEATIAATVLPVSIRAKPGIKTILDIDIPGNAFDGFYTDVGDFGGLAYANRPTEYVGATLPQPAPPSVEYVGTYEDQVLDEIAFENQRVAYLRHTHIRKGFHIHYVSRFVTNDGRFIRKPVWIPELAAFVLKEPATGALVINYDAPYRLYRVNYGLHSGRTLSATQYAWLQGDIAKSKLPSVRVLAIAPKAGRVASTSFEHKVFPSGADLAQMAGRDPEDAEQSTAFSEGSRTTDTVRVFDPNNESNFIDVQRIRTVTLYDENGKPFTYRYQG